MKLRIIAPHHMLSVNDVTTRLDTLITVEIIDDKGRKRRMSLAEVRVRL